MLLDSEDSQLVLVDYQARLMPAIHESAVAIANAVRLGKVARMLDVPVWGTEQNPAGLGENVVEVRTLCQRSLSKMHFSAAADGLVPWLRPAPKPPMWKTHGSVTQSIPSCFTTAPTPSPWKSIKPRLTILTSASTCNSSRWNPPRRSS